MKQFFVNLNNRRVTDLPYWLIIISLLAGLGAVQLLIHFGVIPPGWLP